VHKEEEEEEVVVVCGLYVMSFHVVELKEEDFPKIDPFSLQRILGDKLQ
jgi:hypothetical protein